MHDSTVLAFVQELMGPQMVNVQVGSLLVFRNWRVLIRLWAYMYDIVHPMCYLYILSCCGYMSLLLCHLFIQCVHTCLTLFIQCVLSYCGYMSWLLCDLFIWSCLSNVLCVHQHIASFIMHASTVLAFIPSCTRIFMRQEPINFWTNARTV